MRTRLKPIRGVVALLIALIAVFAFCNAAVVYARADSKEKELSQNADDMLDSLDLTNLERLIDEMLSKERELFGQKSFYQKVKAVISGDAKIAYSDYFSYVLYICGVDMLNYLPVLIAIVGIALAYNIIASVKGKFASASVESIVYFASTSAIILILLTQITALFVETTGFINALARQAQAAFPVLLTVMTALGASSSTAVYQPSVLVLTVTITQLLTTVALPCLMISFVLSVVGSLSERVKLKRMAAFFSSVAKWLLGTMFFLFLAFLSLQGITASVFDGISVRTAKFALSKYVPIIGGYLSEGFNLVLAGGVLIKNAVGLTVIIVFVLTLLPILVNLITFMLTMRLASALTEPLGDSKISALLESVAKHISALIAIVLAVSFLYFIFLILIICTGNLVL